MSVAVVIVAAGRGRRLGAPIPKQYIPLGEKTPLRRTAEIFLSHDAVRWVAPVINPDDADLYHEAMSGLDDPRLLSGVDGADTRARSVRNGLERLAGVAPDVVLIHDAARPFVDRGIIDRVLAALQTADGACAALPVVDALWRSENNTAQTEVSRNELWRAQTPQGFAFAPILSAHRSHDGFGADDVFVAREAGLKVQLVLGSEQNYKITTSADLARARFDAQVQDQSVEASPTDRRPTKGLPAT